MQEASERRRARERSRAQPGRSARAAVSLAVAAAAACSYDFDRYVDAAGSAPNESGSGGRVAGSSGGGTAPAAPGGNGATGGVSVGGAAGDGGATDTGGAAGDPGASGALGAGQAGQGGADGEPSPTAGTGGTATGGTTEAGGGKSGSSAGGGAAVAGSGAAGGSSGSTSFDCAARAGQRFEDRCYFSVGDDSALDWESARAACSDAGAGSHLVTIESAAEQAFLESAFFPAGAPDRWIGLSLGDTASDPPRLCRDLPAACPFSWVTGAEPSFTHWGAHSERDVEPNYSGGCVRIQAATRDWADLECDGALGAICEVD